MTSLEARRLAAGYGHGTRTSIVVEVESLRAAAGQLTAVIGPNGSGKSTLLRTLIGSQPPLRGEVLLDGRDVRHFDRQERARKVAVVLTDRVDPGLLSVSDIVLLGRHPHTGWRGDLTIEDHDIAHGAAARLGVDALWNRQFGELSDGQRQRVLVARALAQQPSVLVLDEPTAFLDIAGRVELSLIVAGLARDGLTVVISTHDLDLALSYADRVWLVAGATVTDYSPAELANGSALAKAFLPADHGAEHAATFEAVVTALHRTTHR